MQSWEKAVLAFTMTLALAFGFFHLLWSSSPHSFERLHIFLFNLCSGGVVLLYYTEGTKHISRWVWIYFALALAYSISAFFEVYWPAIVISIPLLIMVESIRQHRFSFSPLSFFKAGVPVFEKFNHAAILCLSSGLIIASVVMLNNEYLRWFTLSKLTLDVFFLGYSFPLSLITMSLMFSFMHKQRIRFTRVLNEVSFWAITLGVISFFVFIIFEQLILQLVIANLLFLAVCLVFFLFIRNADGAQQKTILLSGMTFLVSTGLTGVFYLLKYYSASIAQFDSYFLTLHVFVSLYGWNLSGLLVVVRRHDFPIRLNSFFFVMLHWTTVLLLAPLGKQVPVIALLAVVSYGALLAIAFFTSGKPGRVESPAGSIP